MYINILIYYECLYELSDEHIYEHLYKHRYEHSYEHIYEHLTEYSYDDARARRRSPARGAEVPSAHCS